ncbi:MAG: O-antigen ligase family protein [Ruminococcus sp.]|nr:O-antigen ligase family protein [Ruminococcus sp.]
MKTNQEVKTDKKTEYRVVNSLVNYYLAIMFSFFPLFLTAAYSHARVDKYIFYLIVTGVMLVSMGGCMIASKMESRRLGEKSALILPLSVTDIFFLCFLGFAVISTLASSDIGAAFNGSYGRNNGLLLLLFYTLMYFALTRNFVYKRYVLGAYLGFSMLVALLTVLNFYNIDPIGIYQGYDESVIADFGSTIGNKNMIAAFMSLYLPVAVMTFTVTDSLKLRILSGAAILLAYSGLLCADSSSAIFGLIIVLPAMLVFSARKLSYLRRYMLALTIMFLSGKVVHLFALIVGDNNKGFEVFQWELIYSAKAFIPAAICAALYLVLRFLVKEEHYPAKAVKIVLVTLCGLGILTGLGALIYFSAIDTETDLGSFERLLRFNDRWGTHRGYMWRISLEEYSRMGFFRKLFGAGPDMLYKVFEPHFAELSARFGDGSTDAAHNEFINYLVTQGMLGLLAYLGIAGSVIIRGWRTAKKNPLALIFLSAVICYLAQSTVNLYTPIVTPQFFIFLSLTEAVARSEELGIRS